MEINSRALMRLIMNKYTCIHCGYSSTDIEDFEPDLQHNKGFWCPYCDGFNYYETEKNRHQFVLILEKAKEKSYYKKPDFPVQVSPLRYPGGKSKFIGPLLAECRKTNLENFVEPFCGGSSVGLSLLLAGKIKNLYLNDLDFGIYSFFYTIKVFPEFLISKIRAFTPSKSAYKEAQKHVLDNCSGLDMFEAAWATLVVNRLAFSGICKANCLSNPMSRWNPDALIRKITAISNYSEHIFVSCEDAISYIEEMYWQKNTTIFIDPPYYVKGKSLYNHYYTEKDHLLLSFTLEELFRGVPGADIVLTYDYCQPIEQMYKYPQKKIVGRTYSIAN